MSRGDLQLGFDINEVLDDFLLQKKVICKNEELLKLCITSLISPVDSKHWPKSWKKTETRLVSILGDLDQDYWDLFKVVDKLPMQDIDEWNDLETLPVAKKVRVFGKAIEIKKIYIGGRYLWDFLVLCYLKKNLGLKILIKDSIKTSDINFVVPKWVIYYVKNSLMNKVVEKKETSHGFTVLEVG